MRTYLILTFLAAVEALSQVQTTQTTHTSTEEIDEFVPFEGQRFDTFDWNLCNVVSKSDPGNVIVSPISVKILLKMLYEGSSGPSSDELAKVLDLPKDKSDSRWRSAAILRSLQTPNPNYEMELGTKIFISEHVFPKNWYQRILYLYYNAYIEKLNFSDPKTAADRINYWVKTITHNRIKDFITPSLGFESTVLLLINAVYFRGTWRFTFPTGDSYQGKFHTPSGPMDVTYMTQTNYFYYARSPQLKAQILRLPYLGQKFSMYIILPEKKDGLEEVISNIKPSELRKHIWLLEETSLEVILPKFKFDYKTELKGVLKQLGIKKIFESYNDLKGLTKNSNLKDIVVSNVIQKAAIEVDEVGSVAAAATEMQLTNKFGGSDEIFNATYPFLFFIEDESTGTIVFVGKLIYPEGKPPPQTHQPQKPPPQTHQPQKTTTTSTTTPANRRRYTTVTTPTITTHRNRTNSYFSFQTTNHSTFYQNH